MKNAYISSFLGNPLVCLFSHVKHNAVKVARDTHMWLAWRMRRNLPPKTEPLGVLSPWSTDYFFGSCSDKNLSIG